MTGIGAAVIGLSAISNQEAAAQQFCSSGCRYPWCYDYQCIDMHIGYGPRRYYVGHVCYVVDGDYTYCVGAGCSYNDVGSC